MDHIVITIRPAPSDAGLLRVGDAMQQVIDAIKLIEQAQRAIVSPQNSFDWKLERASTASPFTVVAVAEAINPNVVDVGPQVQRVKTEVAYGLRNFITRGERPSWMDAESVKVARSIFSRTQNGIGGTDIDFDLGPQNPPAIVSIDREAANAGIRAIEALNILDIEADLPERQAFGEIEGVMIAAGRYRNRPAITVRSELYGFIWCTLSDDLVGRFGAEHTMADIWKGKTVAVLGILNYGVGGKLLRAEALDIREVVSAPPFDLRSVLDPEFTSGLDPNDYLDKLHAGELG